MFKRGENWRTYQIWSEVIAAHLGAVVGLEVPKSFIAWDGRNNVAGSLTELFHSYPGQIVTERLTHGADLLNLLRAKPVKGRQAVRTNVHLCSGLGLPDPSSWWGRTLTFDALIGNTDRHTENWGVLAIANAARGAGQRFAPIYDNGTSLGFEMLEQRLVEPWSENRLRAYVKRGRHHCGWSRVADQPAPHVELCRRFRAAYPRARNPMADVIHFEPAEIEEVLEQATQLQLAVPFTETRARFVSSLIKLRKRLLQEAFDDANEELDRVSG